MRIDFCCILKVATKTIVDITPTNPTIKKVQLNVSDID